jgi:hypothetical protein
MALAENVCGCGCGRVGAGGSYAAALVVCGQQGSM